MSYTPAISVEVNNRYELILKIENDPNNWSYSVTSARIKVYYNNSGKATGTPEYNQLLSGSFWTSISKGDTVQVDVRQTSYSSMPDGIHSVVLILYDNNQGEQVESDPAYAMTTYHLQDCIERKAASLPCLKEKDLEAHHRQLMETYDLSRMYLEGARINYDNDLLDKADCLINQGNRICEWNHCEC